MPPEFLDGLPLENQQGIKEIIGKPVLLNDSDCVGRVELEFKDGNGVSHFIYVAPAFIRPVN